MKNQISSIKTKFQNFSKTDFKHLIFGKTLSGKMFRIFALLIIILTLCLYLPISFQSFFENGYVDYFNNSYHFNIDGKPFQYDFLDAMFTAFSTVTTTGLIIGDTNSIFSMFGKLVIMLFIQLGGFGVLFFIFILFRLFNYKYATQLIKPQSSLLAQFKKDDNEDDNENIKILIKYSIWVFVIELFFGIFYSLWFLLVPAYDGSFIDGFYVENSNFIYLYNNADTSFFAGFFHSVSSMNNAGLNIISSSSLAPYRNGIHTIFLIMTMVQFIIGGIGIPIVYDFLKKFKIRKKVYRTLNQNESRNKYVIEKNLNHKISLFSKLSMSSYIVITLLSIPLILISETTNFGGGSNLLWNNTTSFDNYFDKTINIIFQSMSVRSSGFSTFETSSINSSTKWIFIILMFIGGSPSSTSGGIRTTTLSICLITIYSKFRGRNEVSAFRKTIDINNIQNSFVVVLSGIILVGFGTIILTSYDIHTINNQDWTTSVFMVTSSFGNIGLSTENPYLVGEFSQIYMIILMTIGQYSISQTAFLKEKHIKIKKPNVQILSEKVKLG